MNKFEVFVSTPTLKKSESLLKRANRSFALSLFLKEQQVQKSEELREKSARANYQPWILEVKSELKKYAKETYALITKIIGRPEISWDYPFKHNPDTDKCAYLGGVWPARGDLKLNWRWSERWRTSGPAPRRWRKPWGGFPSSGLHV